MLWDILVSIFWFMLLFAWFWLLVMIVGDLFRDHEISGWAKALWVIVLLVMPASVGGVEPVGRRCRARRRAVLRGRS